MKWYGKDSDMMENDNLRSVECTVLLEALSAYLDGELDAEEAEKIKTHMDNCAECRAVYERLAALSDDIGSVETEAPEDLHQRIMTAVRSTGKVKKKATLQSRLRRCGLWIGAGVAAMLCLVLIGSPIFNGGMGMDLMGGINKAACADEAEAAYDVAIAEVYSSDGGSVVEVVVESIENSLSTVQSDAYYSQYEIKHETDACGYGAPEDDREAETMAETAAQDCVDTTNDKCTEENDLLSKILCIDSPTEAETEEKDLPPIPSFFPERGRLEPKND